MPCDECLKKDRTIGILHTQSENYRQDADLWKRHLFYLQHEWRRVFDIAKDAMWYPSDYKTRGESGHTEQEKAWCDVQSERPNMVPTDR